MSQNVRFFALVAVVVVIVGGLWFVIRSGDDDAPPPPRQKTQTASEKPDRELADAPEPVRQTGSLFTPAASKGSGPRDTSKKALTGVNAVRGLVVWADDQVPVQDAEVQILWADGKALIPVFDEENTWSGRTNAKGFFRIDKLPSGSLLIVATKDDAAGVTSAYPNEREVEDQVVTLELRPSGSIAGRVVNEKQEPIANAIVALGRGKSGARDLWGASLKKKTDVDGQFEIKFIEKGVWTIEVAADGYAVAEKSDLETDGPPTLVVLKPGGSVSGTVVSAESSKPTPNVKVLLASGGQLNRKEAVSDKDGKFEIKDLADGKYMVDVSKQPQILTSTPAPIEIANANSVTDLQLTVVMGGVITGKAFDAETQAPIVNAGFLAQSASGGRTVQGNSDEDGIYRLEGLAAGAYTVRRLWLPGYLHGEDRENKSVNVKLGEEVTGIDFAIQPGLYLRGRVVDKNGEPIPQVSVESVAMNENGEGETMVSDEQGRWVHRGFSAGVKVRITASRAGYSAPPMENVEIGTAGRNDIEIVMDTGGSIAGVVVDKQGNPLQEVYVTAWPTDPSMGQSQMAMSGHEGKFKVQGLGEGTYKMHARPPRTWRETTPIGNDIQVGKGQEVTGVRLEVDFDSGAKIAGRIIDSAGKPVRDASINVYMPTGNSSGYAQTDADGKFEILGLVQGTHRVNVHHQSYSQYMDETVDVPNPSVTITLKGKGSIEGRVLDARSGQPVTNFSVFALAGDVGRVDPGNFWGGGGQSVVDEQGKFRVDGDEGTVTLFVQATGYAPGTHKVTSVREGQSTTGIEIKLQAGGVIDGVVTDKGGQPVSGANVFVGRMPMDWERQNRPAAATTDNQGAFRIESLAAEETRLYVLHGDFGTASASAMPGTSTPGTVRIVLGSGGQIDGSIRVGGKPARGYSVSVYFPEMPGGVQENKQVDADGKFSFTGLPEGEAVVGVYGQRQLSKKVSVVADQTATVEFDIVEGNAILEGAITKDGQPVNSAYVNLMFGSGDHEREGANTQTDSKGNYRFEGMPAGAATLMVHHGSDGANMQSRSFQVELEENATTRYDVNLSGGTKVSGKVTGFPEGWYASVALIAGPVQIPQDMNLQTFYQEYQDKISGGTQLGKDGAFTIEGATPGDYTVVVVAFDPQSRGEVFKHTSSALTVTEDGEASVNLSLP